MIDFFSCVRRDLFYLLDYVTRRSEKQRFEKNNKIGSEPAGIGQLVVHWALGCKVLGLNPASASNPRSDIGQSLQW